MLERLNMLEGNIEELNEFKSNYSIDQIKDSKPLEWALRYGYLESIQIIIDISCHLVGKYNLGNPTTYNQCIELLKKFNYIDSQLEENLVGMVGLRNLLAHEYTSIKIEKLYALLDRLSDMIKYVESVKSFL